MILRRRQAPQADPVPDPVPQPDTQLWEDGGRLIAQSLRQQQRIRQLINLLAEAYMHDAILIAERDLARRRFQQAMLALVKEKRRSGDSRQDATVRGTVKEGKRSVDKGKRRVKAVLVGSYRHLERHRAHRHIPTTTK